jgi:hypothetical protein
MLRPLSKAGKLNWCFGMRDRKALAAYRSAKWSSFEVEQLSSLTRNAAGCWLHFE